MTRGNFEELLFDAIRAASDTWKEEFVKSIYKQSLNPFFSPSQKQTAKLEEIAEYQSRCTDDYQDEIPF